jgi:DNA-binding winged helix-turn-helix (wHTH) protein/tetratricopeptide (TPR) repeat protein
VPTVYDPNAALRFGPFVLDPGAHTLTRGGASIEAEPKVFTALHHLVRHPRALITREQFLAVVWPDAVVSDDSVSQIIKKIRKVLGDAPRSPRWVKTVHGKGYRFVGKVKALVAEVALPFEADSGFFGRKELLSTLTRSLSSPGHLVTLLGPGGIGKTRLVTEYLRTRSGSVRAWFADCASARSLEELTFAIAQALGIPLTGTTSAADHIASVLSARPAGLLVLDNLEQVLEPARAVLARCLQRAPQMAFLATSRIPLGLPDEQTVPVGPLNAAAAGALFRARAQAVRESPVPDALLDELVSRLDREPLSIELAATRASVMSPAQILERLDERLSLLGRRGGPTRHKNLRHNLSWGWELLEPDLQELLEQCAGFQAGFTLDLAEAVVRLPSGTWPGDVLQDLADLGLLRPIDAGPPLRLRMAEALRLFCHERALARPDGHNIALRTASVLADMGERLARLHARGEEEGSTLASWLPDLRLALETSLAHQPDQAARLALTMHTCLQHSGPHQEARRHLDRALAAGPRPELELRLLCAQVSYTMPVEQTARLLERARILAAALDIPERTCDVLIADAEAALAGGNRELALELLDDALRVARKLHHTDTIGSILTVRANTLRVLGRFDAATESAAEGLAMADISSRTESGLVQAKALADHRAGRMEAALAGMSRLAEIVEQLDDLRGRLIVASFTAVYYTERDGEHDKAAAAYDEALVVARDLGDEAFEARLATNLSVLQICTGDWASAAGTAQRSRHLAQRLNDHDALVTAILNQGVARLMMGEHGEAGRILAEAAELPPSRFVGWVRLWQSVATAQSGSMEEARTLLDLARDELSAVEDITGPACLDLADAVLTAHAGQHAAARELAAPHAQEFTHKLELLRTLLARELETGS